MVRQLFLFLMFCVTTLSQGVSAGVMQVSISGIGSNISLYLDFIDGDGSFNQIRVNSIFTDGVISDESSFGSVVEDSDGYIISDDSFISTLYFDVVNASSFDFMIYFSEYEHFSDDFMDSLSVYLYSDNFYSPAVITDDPLGGNSLFMWSPDNSNTGVLSLYSSYSNDIYWSVEFLNDAIFVEESHGILIFIFSLFLVMFSRAFR